MVDFKFPPLSKTFTESWGPPPHGEEDFAAKIGICDFVEHLDKFPLTKIGKICDFTASGQRWMQEKGKGGKGPKGFGKGKAGFVPVAPPKNDDEGFSLVDSRPLTSKGNGKGRGGASRSKGKGKGKDINYQEGILGQRPKLNAQKGDLKGKGKGRGGLQRRGLPSFREWSVQTKTEWEMKREIMLHSLAKLQLNANEVLYEDLMWCGTLHTYNRVYDRVTTKTEKRLARYEDLGFFNVTTSDDWHLQEMLTADPTVTVIATDHILACLIAAARSVYSWDVIISKVAGKIIIDKRNGSQIDFLSVNETAQDPPNVEDKDSYNGPVRLSQEASCINQNFSQMCLDREAGAKELDAGNPFDPDDGETQVASGAYRYRKITLPGNPKSEDEFEKSPLVMVVRTEVNARMPDEKGGKGLVSVKALNEYEPKPNYAWRSHLESQRGACLATELKNNSFKLGRWTAQAILSGCDTMKIGYLSRQTNNDPLNHTLLGVQTHMTDGFAEQIGLTRNNMFGILRAIIDMVMQWEDGKYLVLKDPTKSVLRLYEVPWDCFQSDDEDEEEHEEEEEQELDEDGNIAPQQPG